MINNNSIERKKWRFTGSSNYSNNLGGIIFKQGQITDYEEIVRKFPSFFELVVQEEEKRVEKIIKVEKVVIENKDIEIKEDKNEVMVEENKIIEIKEEEQKNEVKPKVEKIKKEIINNSRKEKKTTNKNKKASK
jgi:hypothetical protein